MKTEHVPNGRSIPVFTLRHSHAFLLTIAMIGILNAENTLFAQGQSGKSASGAGGGELFSIDFAEAPLGAPPDALLGRKGDLEVVEKDGARMLRSSSHASFLIQVPVKIPNSFTLEFDLVPKFSGDTRTTELSFEGTRENSQSDESAHVLWSHHQTVVLGGGMDYTKSRFVFPADLREEVIGTLTNVRAEFDGDNFKLFTNGQQIYDGISAKFVRGRVVRITLGGEDKGDNAVYLARVRMTGGTGVGGTTAQQQGAGATGSTSTTGAPAAGDGAVSNEMTDSSTDTHTASPVTSQSISGLSVAVDANGVATVTWNPLTVAATYEVQRWNVSDPTCCNNMSPPGAPLQNAMWQDGVLPVAGTYAYRVIAKTAAGLIAGETQISYRGSATPPPGVATAPIPAVNVPTIAPEPVTTTSSTYMTPGRIAALSPPPGDSSVVQFPPPAPSSDLPTLEESLPPAENTSTGGETSPTGTVVTAEPAPYSSGPRSVSVMPTEPAPSTPEPVTAILAEPVSQTGTITPIAAPTEPAPTEPGSGGGMVTTGTYRVVIAGLSVQVLSKDDPSNLDGMGDEAYAAAAVVNWNRKLNQLTNFTTTHSLDYGDVGAAVVPAGRIKAGSASMTGGLAVGDYAPNEFDPKGTSLPAPTGDRFPLLVWEGTLTAGTDAVVISPSVWKRDLMRNHLTAYKDNWKLMSSSALMISPVIANQLLNPSLMSSVTTLADSVRNAPPTPTFNGDVTKGYQIVETQFVQGNDRPIGLARRDLLVVNYLDRFIVLTQEKVASMKVGEGQTLHVFFTEPWNITTLGAAYTLYVRVERAQ
jgi:hypothetical protein